MTASTLEMRGRFERRLIFLQAFAVLLLLLLFASLVDLQWLQHEGFLLQAERNRINVVPILPTRGEIVDRNGKGLALNAVSYNLTLIPERVEDVPAVLGQLQQLMHWSKERSATLGKRISRSRNDRPVLL
ncbi:MAG: penicillin-binding protein 2, partial [Mariprofundaceae bacterium]|nr:penicillin-binding protein 2 [Mariprofundaceae bacterium]